MIWLHIIHGMLFGASVLFVCIGCWTIANKEETPKGLLLMAASVVYIFVSLFNG